MDLNINPLSAEFRANPYPAYARLRDEAPVYHEPMTGTYMVSRYDDVVAVLKQPTVFSSQGVMMNMRGRPTNTVLSTDPPLHTQLRNLVNRAFTPRMVADLEPRIREITRELLDRVCETGSCDLVADLAIPLPVTVIAEILGVDAERRGDFKRWSNAVVTQEPAQGVQRDRIERDLGEFQEYFDAVIEERRRQPRGDDLISSLLRAQEDEQLLDATDVLAFTALLLVAGNETTTNLIGNAVLALLAHPQQLALVRGDPGLVPNWVEEALRWDSPVQFLFRACKADTEVAGNVIPQGAGVVPIFAAANRDERRYAGAERFDVTRNAQGHLAFGYGVHFCLGAPLARLEARVALEQVLERMPGLERADDEAVERLPSMFLRGLTALPLRFAPTPVLAGG